MVARGTGMRRGELCALQWGQVDLDVVSIQVERSMEETNEGCKGAEVPTWPAQDQSAGVGGGYAAVAPREAG